MNTLARQSPLQFLFVGAATQIMRRRYLSLSIVAHAVLLALMYYYGSYQPELRQQAADVASSLRATSRASTAQRLQDLQTIKQLLEKSADRVDPESEPSPAPSTMPETPEEMLERARDLSRAIEELDKEIRAEELAELTGEPESPPAPEPQTAEPPTTEQTAGEVPPANVTEEQAAREVAELEAKARATLERRRQRLEAKANGVPVEGQKSGSGEHGEDSGTAVSSVEGGGSDTAVRKEIGEFIDARERMEQTGQGNYGSQGNDIFDRSYLEVPPVDASSLVLGRGRMLGAGGEYANRIYVNSWYIIGPFPGRNGIGLFDNPSFPPEKAVLLDAVYYGKDQRLLKWRYVTAQSYPLYPPDEAEDSVYYGYTEVFVDQACDLTAWIGSDDDLQIYMNDRLVWKGGNVGKRPYFDAIFNPNSTFERDYNRTEGKRAVHFNKGRNKIFFKLSNGPNLGFVSLVLTRADR